jgi:hypothetical protein
MSAFPIDQFLKKQERIVERITLEKDATVMLLCMYSQCCGDIDRKTSKEVWESISSLQKRKKIILKRCSKLMYSHGESTTDDRQEKRRNQAANDLAKKALILDIKVSLIEAKALIRRREGGRQRNWLAPLPNHNSS